MSDVESKEDEAPPIEFGEEESMDNQSTAAPSEASALEEGACGETGEVFDNANFQDTSPIVENGGNAPDTSSIVENGGNAPDIEEPPAPIVIPIPNNNHMEKEPVDESAIEMKEFDKSNTMNNEERKTERERLFFVGDGSKRVDYVLVYQDTDESDKRRKRRHFERNLDESGLDLEYRTQENSVDEKSNFVLLHATWDAVGAGAELLNLRKRIKMPKDVGGGGCFSCCHPFSAGEDVVPEEDDYFTAPFHFDKLEMFEFDPTSEEDRESFFTNAERSLVVKELLDRTSFSNPNSKEQRFGIQKLLNEGVYTAAFPLHEGTQRPLPADPTPWEGKDKDRARLYEAWARPGRWYCYQPLDLIRKYFGEKIAIYFAWLGYYTTALIPAALLGFGAFLFGCITMFEDEPSDDICDKDGVGNFTMCPPCDDRCDYYKLKDSCIYARVTYIFDNYATVFFAVIMAIWAVCFMEFWKRYQNVLRYEWDVAEFELEERMRPEFEFKVKKTKENPITKLREPYVPFLSKVLRVLTSYSVVLTMILVVCAAIFSVILYRIIVVVIFSQLDEISEYTSIVTSITAALANLIAIMILNILYGWIAMSLTDLELHRTESDYENGLIFKMFLFKFVNFYGSTFYIAYFKGSFVGHPGSRRNYLFGDYRPDACDPAGCMVDLFLHLAFIMVGKQAINNTKELLLPWFLKCIRARSSAKGETSTNLYMRWEQDNDYGAINKLGLFEEYLEMVIQYGFVTLFVAAFPLAPFFALLNNIIEIRLDAFKFVSIWRRPHAAKAQGIGIWLDILQGLSFLAILTNAFIIGWTSDFVPKLVYSIDHNNKLDGYMEHSLSIFNVSDFHGDQSPNDPSKEFDDIQTCMYRGYRDPPESEGDNEYRYTRDFYIIFTARLAVVIVFEHICFLVTWFISYAIPDTPASVERLRLYEKQLVKKLTFDKTFEDLKTKRKTVRESEMR